MPDLQSLGDTTSLQNRYSGRFIFYVEGPGDQAAYKRIANAPIDVEFKLPPDGKTGASAVKKRVRAERETNRRVFGLLDGEAAAALGAIDALLVCDELMFSPDVAGLEGLIFVAVHELENLILCFSDVAPIITDHQRMARLDLHEPDDVRQRLLDLSGRFFAAAMFKYASLQMQHAGDCVHVIDTGIFSTGSGVREILTQMRAVVEQRDGLQWTDFSMHLYAVTRTLRQHVAKLPPPSIDRQSRRLRLADGKGLLAKLRSHSGNVGKEVEGHLLSGLLRTGFPVAFRDALLAHARSAETAS